MRIIQYTAVLALATLLSACGGHDFEGVYETRAGSDNELLNSFAELASGEKLVIGSDYIESQGQRTLFDDIFERESAGERYLVFKTGAQEEVWKVVDDNTLIKGSALVNVKLVRLP
ncbi:MAG: hypothetical protein V7756_10745 [Halopseudomonas sp.]|uniref:hypothetical protein n=1 Tax=Halopseudomonas sp. TaxID=2901191 RepID=UPI0030028EA4